MARTKQVVTIGVTSWEEVKDSLRRAFQGEKQGSHISFLTVEQMWQTLTPKRWDILQVMTGAGVLSIREVARRVGRDVKAVHADVTALAKAGVIDRKTRGVVFPYDEIHVDFVLRKAA
jgi:predicted transcriptional regulator